MCFSPIGVVSVSSRLIKEGLCERSTAPSVSAISRYLRDTSDDNHKSESSGKEQFALNNKFLTRKTNGCVHVTGLANNICRIS